MKNCPKCNQVKNLSCFSKHREDKFQSYCKDCTKVVQLKYKDRYKAKNGISSKAWKNANKSRVKGIHLKHSYGMSIEQYELMLSSQNGLCEICKKPETAKTKEGKLKTLSVDHCHTTGQIRGLLCDGCNRGLGYFQRQ